VDSPSIPAMKKYTSACLFLVIASSCASIWGTNSGTYVEARTASVFAGACHYGSEYTTAGREAILAWRFDGGAARGAEVVAVVSSQQNLAEGDPDRRSVLYVGGPDHACEAAVDVLMEKGVLGEVVAIEDGAEVCVQGEKYRVRAGSGVKLTGELLPDRECCSMPSNVWYEPISSERGGIVGNSTVFECEVPALGVRFERTGENDAFVGSFAW